MKYLLSFTVSVLVAAVVISCLPVFGESRIYSDVLRLHVIAESDSEEDQAIKLKVRDAVLKTVSETVGGCHTIQEAVAAVDGARGQIRKAAEACVRENGKNCNVTVVLGQEKYPRREYEGVALPAGEYQSLRVILGEGEGHNWWCVLFPSVCLRFSSADEYASVGLTPAEYRMITGENGAVKVRFRILEILSEVLGFSTEATCKSR